MNIGLLAVDREKAKREAYKKLCYNFEYKFGSNIPHCVLRSGVCDEDCEYMKVFTIKRYEYRYGIIVNNYYLITNFPC